ncbi:hypothetical protein [Caudoviricetes sp.]|nr:hypothetical protein [Caudoviricetes sp.]UOF79133.1 hypothetical protein [Caudoviricetes sp.]
MNKLFLALFPQGQRKLVVTILALAVGAGFEKFGGGLTDEMVTTILGIVGIFTSGNMIEHIVAAFGGKKKDEDRIEPDMVEELEYRMSVPQVDPVSKELSEIKAFVNNLNEQLKVQANNTAQVVQIINNMRQANTVNQAGAVQRQSAPPRQGAEL